MSLAREALRIATVRALRGATWVGDRVRDSEAGPFDDQAQDKPEPGIIVYTDDGKFGGGAQSKTLFAGGETNLVIEIVITQRMRVRVLGENGPEEQILWDMPETDAAMELTLGMIERQVKVALSDPGNIWGEMWRRFALAIGEPARRQHARWRPLRRPAARASGHSAGGPDPRHRARPAVDGVPGPRRRDSGSGAGGRHAARHDRGDAGASA